MTPHRARLGAHGHRRRGVGVRARHRESSLEGERVGPRRSLRGESPGSRCPSSGEYTTAASRPAAVPLPPFRPPSPKHHNPALGASPRVGGAVVSPGSSVEGREAVTAEDPRKRSDPRPHDGPGRAVPGEALPDPTRSGDASSASFSPRRSTPRAPTESPKPPPNPTDRSQKRPVLTTTLNAPHSRPSFPTHSPT